MRVRAGLIAVSLGTLATACSGEARRHLAAPDLTGAKGLVAVLHGAEGPRVDAVDLEVSPDWRIEASFVEGDAAAVDLLVYDCPLEAWLASPADLVIAERDGEPVPPPARVYAASTEDDFEAWRAIDVVPERTAALRFEYRAPTRCGTLEVEATVPFGGPSEPRLLIALDEDRAVAGTLDGSMYEVSRDGTVTRFHEGARSGDDPYVAGFGASDGTVFLMSNGACCLDRVDTSTITRIDCLPLTGGPDDGRWMHIDGEITAEGLEAYALPQVGETFAMRPGTNTFENVTPPGGRSAGRKAGVLRIGQGQALFTGNRTVEVVRYDRGTVHVELAGISELDRANGLGLTETYGPMIATNLGSVQSQTSGAWREFGRSGVPEGQYVLELDGRIFVAGSGIIAEVGADGEACDAALALGSEIVRLVQTGPRTFMMTSRGDNDSIPELSFVRASANSNTTCEER